jgi:hypothetical protein
VTDEVLEEFRDLHAELRFKPLGLTALLSDVDRLVHPEMLSSAGTGPAGQTRHARSSI